MYGEPLLGTLQPGAPADITVYEYGPPTPLEAGNLAGHWVFGLSPGQVRDVYVAGVRVVADRASTRTDQAEVAADGARVAQDLWQRLEKVPAHEYQPLTPTGGEPRMRAALYLQDKHPIRDGMEYARYAEDTRLRGRVAGGEPARAGGHRTHGRLRRRHRAASRSPRA